MAARLKPAVPWIKAVLHMALVGPILWLAWQWYLAYDGQAHGLGFNPFETSNRFTGIWALRLLLASLAISPLARLLHLSELVLFRRMLGLWAFGYGALHLLSYAWLDNQWAWAGIWRDVTDRSFITLGVSALLLMVPLAATSTKRAMRRMKKRWKQVHSLVYPASILALLHFVLMIKGAQTEPLIYGAILGMLLLFRLSSWLRKRIKRANRLDRPATQPETALAANIFPLKRQAGV